MRRFTEESVWRKSVDQEDIVEKQLQNKGRSECGTDIKDELHEECGVFGAYNLKGEDICQLGILRSFFSAASRTGKLWHRSQ